MGVKRSRIVVVTTALVYMLVYYNLLRCGGIHYSPGLPPNWWSEQSNSSKKNLTISYPAKFGSIKHAG